MGKAAGGAAFSGRIRNSVSDSEVWLWSDTQVEALRGSWVGQFGVREQSLHWRHSFVRQARVNVIKAQGVDEVTKSLCTARRVTRDPPPAPLTLV